MVLEELLRELVGDVRLVETHCQEQRPVPAAVVSLKMPDSAIKYTSSYPLLTSWPSPRTGCREGWSLAWSSR